MGAARASAAAVSARGTLCGALALLVIALAQAPRGWLLVPLEQGRVGGDYAVDCTAHWLEPASNLFMVALAPKKLGYKAQCAGNSDSIAKHCNAVDGLFGPNPKGRWLFSRISAVLVAHLATAKPRSSRLELRENSRRRNHE